MILISAGMPKSGSTLLANYQEDLLKASGRASAQALLAQRYTPAFRPWTAARLARLGRQGDMVLKTHSPLNLPLRSLIHLGLARATFSHRDPRDVLLSAIDHGERTRRGEDPSGAFAGFRSVESGLPLLRGTLVQAERWFRHPGVLLIGYADLINEPETILRRVADLMEWRVSDGQIRESVDRQAAARESTPNFNKGTLGRHESEMSEAERHLCDVAMARFLSLKPIAGEPRASTRS